MNLSLGVIQQGHTCKDDFEERAPEEKDLQFAFQHNLGKRSITSSLDVWVNECLTTSSAKKTTAKIPP